MLCPTNAPFYDGQKCVSCSDPTPIFDNSISRCSSCPSGTIYNANTHKCDRLPNLSNNAATNYVGTIPVPSANDVPCDIKTPFYDGTKCISCQDPTPLFDTVNRKCFACPANTQFDSTSNQCKPLPTVTNTATGTLYIGPTPVATSTDIPCPNDQPYFDGSKCIACTSPNIIFDTNSLKCTSCPATTEFNILTHTCEPMTPVTAPTPTGSNPNAQNRAIGTIPVTSNPCSTTAAPFFDGSKCIDCAAPTPYFDVASKKCVDCVNGVYNSKTNKCDLYNANNPQGQTIGTTTTTTTDVYCPVATPFFDGTKCLGCTDATAPYFDISAKKCVGCPQNFVYDTTSKSCVSQMASASNPSGADRTIGTLPAPGPNDLLCPTDTPFFVNGTCEACSDPSAPYFFPALNDCVACSQDQTYDVATHSCIAAVTKPPTTLPYVSNLAKSSHWVSPSPYADLKTNVQQIASGTVQACP